VALEVDVSTPELNGEPFAAVEPNLNVEREPCLKSGTHKTEVRMDEVLVDVQALPRSQFQAAFVSILRSMIFETHAWLDGSKRADESTLDGILRKELVSEVFLADLPRLQVPERPLVAMNIDERGFFHSLTGLMHEVLEVEQSALAASRKKYMPPSRISGNSEPRKTSRSKPERTPVIWDTKRDTKRSMAPSLGCEVVSQPPSYQVNGAISLTWVAGISPR